MQHRTIRSIESLSAFDDTAKIYFFSLVHLIRCHKIFGKMHVEGFETVVSTDFKGIRKDLTFLSVFFFLLSAGNKDMMHSGKR